MFEVNETPKDPLYLRVIRVILIIITSITMFIYLYSAVFYIVSGPSFTLVEDTTTEFLIQISLLGVALFFMILAWFRHIPYGIASSLFTIGFVAYTYTRREVVDLGIMPWLLLGTSISFIILGLIKNYRKKNMSDILSEPLKDEFNGPDVYKFGLK